MKVNYLAKIRQFYTANHRMPSYSEIMEITGSRSRKIIFKTINSLCKEGYIAKDATGRIVPKAPFNEILFFRNYIEAGTGWISPADEELRDTINLDQYLIGNREATVFVPVKGDSMIEANIADGDIVIAERGASYKDEDIVIARVDGKYVLKKLRKEGKKAWLEPANKKYKPIYPKEELVVVAVVKALVRKY